MRISFDFDDTLTLPYKTEEGLWVSSTRYAYKEICSRMHEHSATGDDVIVVTSRYSSDKAGVLHFIGQHNLPIDQDDVYFTEGKLKYRTLLSLDIDRHYDDDALEVDQCLEAEIDARWILHPHDYKEYELKDNVFMANIPDNKIIKTDFLKKVTNMNRNLAKTAYDLHMAKLRISLFQFMHKVDDTSVAKNFGLNLSDIEAIKSEQPESVDLTTLRKILTYNGSKH